MPAPLKCLALSSAAVEFLVTRSVEAAQLLLKVQMRPHVPARTRAKAVLTRNEAHSLLLCLMQRACARTLSVCQLEFARARTEYTVHTTHAHTHTRTHARACARVGAHTHDIRPRARTDMVQSLVSAWTAGAAESGSRHIAKPITGDGPPRMLAALFLRLGPRCEPRRGHIILQWLMLHAVVQERSARW